MYPTKPATKLYKVVTGSSGNLFSQIQQNAPFEVFLSADITAPTITSTQQQQADANSLAIYSKGQIALWTNNPYYRPKKAYQCCCNSISNVLPLPIHNAYAPCRLSHASAFYKSKGFGRQYKRKVVLKAKTLRKPYSLYKRAMPKSVYLLISFITRAPALAGQGQSWLIPQNLYPPLEQAMVVTKRGQANPWAYRYLRFYSRLAHKLF
ncbi:MAG: molybdate ABC transporter substrate-binding protein [Moraxellaceae bacterium]|nr:molybdate ABC transporter substrate-binding protein [Moraxellaceae bacterium]